MDVTFGDLFREGTGVLYVEERTVGKKSGKFKNLNLFLYSFVISFLFGH